MKLFKRAAATPAPSGVAAEAAPPSRERYNGVSGTRRSFLQKLGAAAALVGLGGFAYQAFRSLVPNVLYEAPKRFKIGSPASLAEGVTFLEDKRLYVFKEGKSVYAISAACTHLGCTVEWNTEGEQFDCPCHGSKFKADGQRFAGPAPRGASDRTSRAAASASPAPPRAPGRSSRPRSARASRS